MEAKFRGLPYRPWLSCIVTKLQRDDQTIVRNCTVVMVAAVRQGYVKVFKEEGFCTHAWNLCRRALEGKVF